MTENDAIEIIVLNMKTIHMIRLLLLFVFVMMCGSARAEGPYFYTGKDYGSQGNFNPLSVIINGGFDIFQVRTTHDVFQYPYGIAAANVVDNLGHAPGVIHDYTWRDFIAEEVFPYTMDLKNARWWPNYTLHLIGGGVIWATLHEYFQYYEIPAPWLWGTLTYWSYHFLNETVENERYQGRTVDPIADLYIFVVLGQVLFSFNSVRRFFGGTLHMSDWSLQPTFVYPDGYLENSGQYFSLKWLLPFPSNETVHFFAYYGLNVILGFSYKFSGGYNLSLGAGARTKKVRRVAGLTFKQTINYVYSGGIFLDRDDSLLASLVVNTNFYHTVQLNVYPGIIRLPYVSPGFWINVSERGGIMFGITCRYVPGVGYRSPGYYPTD